MAIKAKNLVRETSATTGTGTYTLAGAVTGFQSFSAWGANNYGVYRASDGVNYEVAWGRYLAGPARLERTQILESSNGGAAVDWAAGTRTLENVDPAEFAFPGLTDRNINTIFAATDATKSYRITGSYTQTFSAAATLGDGWEIKARVEAGATWTLDPDAAETIDGAATLAIVGPWAGEVKCNGTALYTLGATIPATQAQQEAGSDVARPVTPGRQQFHPSAAKAWVTYDASSGTPTIQTSYNVTSLTDNAVGSTTVNFTVPFSGARYPFCLNAGRGGSVGDFAGGTCEPFTDNPTTTTFRFITYDSAGTLRDMRWASATFFGDQ